MSYVITAAVAYLAAVCRVEILAFAKAQYAKFREKHGK